MVQCCVRLSVVRNVCIVAKRYVTKKQSEEADPTATMWYQFGLPTTLIFIKGGKEG